MLVVTTSLGSCNFKEDPEFKLLQTAVFHFTFQRIGEMFLNYCDIKHLLKKEKLNMFENIPEWKYSP